MKAFLYPHGGSGNHGCEAIVKSTKSIFENNGIQFDYVLCTDNKEQDIEAGIDGVDFLETRKIESYSFRNIVEKIVNKTLKKYSLATTYRVRGITDNLADSSLCFSIGGDNYSYRGSIPYKILRLNDIGLKKKCRLVLWGCSINEECLNKCIVNDLKKYSLITPRESITYNALLKAGIGKNIYLYPDPAFTLPTRNLELPTRFIEGKTIGLNISPLIQNMDVGGNIAYRNYRALVEFIINETDFQIALIPHVVWAGNNDLNPLSSLYNEFESTDRLVLLGNHNVAELKGFISRCRLFIGARTHATIAAYSTCVPTLVAGYSVKAKGIAKDIFGDYKNYVISVQSLKNENTLVEGFKWIIKNEDSIRSHLHSFMPGYIRKTWKSGEVVKALLEGKV